MKKPSHPMPRPSRGALDAVNEQGQILGTQMDTRALPDGRGKGPTIQPFETGNRLPQEAMLFISNAL